MAYHRIVKDRHGITEMMQFGRRGLDNLKTLRQRYLSRNTDVKGCMDMEKIRIKQA